MNIYFLVEGAKTEPKVYPQWLRYLIPELLQVKFAREAKENNYYLLSGKGSPRLLTEELANSVTEINELGNYNHLVLVIDTDNVSEQEKIEEVEKFMADNGIILNDSCHLHIVAQKCCIETWFLGNRKVYTKNPGNQSDFYNHKNFYDVSKNNPESMLKPNQFNGSTSIYHEVYLRKMLAEKNIRYSKSDPREVGESYYLDELKKRVNETNHLSSLKIFLNFCESI